MSLIFTVEEHWSKWGTWTTCSVTCGKGTRTRTRTCFNPWPKRRGVNCAVTSTQSHTCTVGICRSEFLVLSGVCPLTYYVVDCVCLELCITCVNDYCLQVLMCKFNYSVIASVERASLL